MKKAVITFLSVSCALILLMLTACAETKMKIDEFPQYKNLTKTPAKIIVYYSDAYEGTYEITDRETIDEVVSILFETTYIKGKNGHQAGNNGTITFVDANEEQTSISLHAISYNNALYFPESNDLLLKVYRIGMELGALHEK